MDFRIDPKADTDLEDDNDTLDLSWIEEERTLLQCTYMQKTPLQTIRLQCIYVNPESDIVAQHTHSCSLTMHETRSILPLVLLRPYLETKVMEHIQYSLDQTLIYHIDVDATHLPAYLSSYDAVSLVPVSANADLVIESALPIFHPIIELFAFFKGTSAGKIHIKRPSSLKHTRNLHSTKRVRISELAGKQTRKHI